MAPRALQDKWAKFMLPNLQMQPWGPQDGSCPPHLLATVLEQLRCADAEGVGEGTSEAQPGPTRKEAEGAHGHGGKGDSQAEPEAFAGFWRAGEAASPADTVRYRTAQASD